MTTCSRRMASMEARFCICTGTYLCPSRTYSCIQYLVLVLVLCATLAADHPARPWETCSQNVTPRFSVCLSSARPIASDAVPEGGRAGRRVGGSVRGGEYRSVAASIGPLSVLGVVGARSVVGPRRGGAERYEVRFREVGRSGGRGVGRSRGREVWR
jgi:hypothetical protein